jgi:RNA-directed DNA polymerase
MVSLIEAASLDCKVSVEWVNSVLRAGPSSVKKIKIPKKSSGYRLVSRPSAELEILQRWLVLKFLSKVRVHPLAMAFLPGRSILSNANIHRGGRYFVRVDFKDFFPSITSADLVRAIWSDKSTTGSLTSYEGYYEFLDRVCFDSIRSLPIGYISSPVISNIVMWDFDVKLTELLASNQLDLGNANVTRYADDIVFSTDKKGGCRKFVELFSSIVATQKYPALKINSEKTAYSSRAAGTAMVTGLRVCADKHVTVTRKYKDGIRLMLALHSKGILKEEDFPVLQGHLSYVRNVAPAFFSNICLKYVGIISKFI